MAPKRIAATHRPSKAERAASRAKVGKLSEKLLSAATSTRYGCACANFFRWLKQNGLVLPANTTNFDDLLVLYIDCAWEEGESKSHIGDLLSSLQYYVPSIRGCLNAAWRMHSAWSRHELPSRCFPMTLEMAHGLAGLALHWQWFDMCIGILVAFDCLLRTGELMQMRVGDIMINASLNFATINLPDTKGEKRTGVTDSVSITDPLLVRLLARFIQDKLPGDLIVQRQSQTFRRCFKQLVDGLYLYNLLLKPYSMRRGGATSLFRNTNSLDVVVLRGRWTHQRTARIYVNTSLQDIAAHNICPEAVPKLLAARTVLHNEMAT